MVLTVKDVEEKISCNNKHVYYLAYMGQIEGIKIRGTWRFTPGSVEDYVKRRDPKRDQKPASGHTYH